MFKTTQKPPQTGPKTSFFITNLDDIYNLFYETDSRLVPSKYEKDNKVYCRQRNVFFLGSKKGSSKDAEVISRRPLLPEDIFDGSTIINDPSRFGEFREGAKEPNVRGELFKSFIEKPKLIEEISQNCFALFYGYLDTENVEDVIQYFPAFIQKRLRKEFSEEISTEICTYAQKSIYNTISIMITILLLDNSKNFLQVWEKFFREYSQKEKTQTDSLILKEVKERLESYLDTMKMLDEKCTRIESKLSRPEASSNPILRSYDERYRNDFAEIQEYIEDGHDQLHTFNENVSTPISDIISFKETLDNIENKIIALEQSLSTDSSGKEAFIKRRKKVQNDELIFFTAEQLSEYGLTSIEVAEQLIRNDARLYSFENGDINAGTVEQLTQLIESFPFCWGLLFHQESRTIVGNYSYCFLDDATSDLLRRGELTGNQVTAQAVSNPIGADELTLYLMNVSVNPEYKSSPHYMKYWNVLFEELGDSISFLISSGVFLNFILAALFLEEFEAIYSNKGFKRLAVRKGDSDYHVILGIDLFNGLPEWLSVNISGNLQFKQLSSEKRVSTQQLKDIARLVYDTDPYVYSSLFSSRQKALDILPILFDGNTDNQFNLDNCFVAILNDRIVGLILYHQGSFVWDSSSFDMIYHLDASENDISNLQTVKKEYFSVYNKETLENHGIKNTDDVIILLNFSVHKTLRYNVDYGIQLLKEFLKNKGGQIYLRAIPSITHDLKCYLGTGFKAIAQTTGYSLSEEKPKCIVMLKDQVETQNK